MSSHNENVQKLKISTRDEVLQYKEKLKNLDTSVDDQKPWSMVQIVGGFSALAQVDADKRIGPMVFKFHGKTPSDLVVHVSE